jgi:hypothetical protein
MTRAVSGWIIEDRPFIWGSCGGRSLFGVVPFSAGTRTWLVVVGVVAHGGLPGTCIGDVLAVFVRAVVVLVSTAGKIGAPKGRGRGGGGMAAGEMLLLLVLLFTPCPLEGMGCGPICVLFIALPCQHS